MSTVTEDFQVCTGCGDEGFVCIVGNGNTDDAFNGPYTLCEEAFKEWIEVGDEVVWQHD